MQGAPLGRGFTASPPPPHSCAHPLARKARRRRAIPEGCSVWGVGVGSVLSMGHLDPVSVGGSHPVKDPGPGDMGGWQTLEAACWSGAPHPPPHLYPLTLAPILCGGFRYHPHLQDLQGSELGLGTGKLSGQGLSARGQWVFSSGSQAAHRRPVYSAPLQLMGCQVQCPCGWAVSLWDPGVHHGKPTSPQT